MNTKRYDLHCHTTFSDGTDTPEEIIALAKEQGLAGLSITDHDTLDAYPRAEKAAKEQGLALLPGVELSASHKGTNVHILAYAVKSDSKVIADFCERHYRRRLERNGHILDLLSKHGLFLEEKELEEESLGTPGRPHIALALVKKGYVKSIQEAFDKYIGDKMPCYHSGERFSVEETLDIIHKANGLAILAHPHNYKDSRIVKELLHFPFNGIECYYARFAPEQERTWIDIAKNKGLIITGGSDYHGTVKPNSALGTSWVDDETFQTLYLHYLSHNGDL